MNCAGGSRLRRTGAALLGLALLGLCGNGAVLAQDVESLYKSAATDFHRLRTTGQTPGNQTPAAEWQAVARRFLAIHEAQPAHRRGAHALFSAGLAYREAYQAGQDPADISEAVDVFHRFASRYPEDALADDCLVHIGDIFSRIYNDPRVAALEYQKVQRLYPSGDQAQLARERAEALPAFARPTNLQSAVAPNPTKLGTGTAAVLAAAAPSQTESRAAPGFPSTLKRVQFLSTLDWTRVILTLSAPVEFRQADLPPAKGLPRRLFLDLPVTAIAPEVEARTDVRDAALTQIRIGKGEGDSARVVLDLKDVERFAVKSFDLPRETKIVLDLHAKPQPAVVRKEPKKAPAGIAEGAPSRASLSRALGLKVRTIVIDAGHGGHDPGAVAHGLKEKDVTLHIASELREVIRKRRPDLNVVMTRDDDRFLSLQRRTQVSREVSADLFVSIHINANDIDRFSGVETYFLNLTTDASALEVAARENASTEKQVSDLNGILLDLLRDTNIVESGRLAKTLQSSLVSELHPAHGVKDLGVKQAPFMVLLGSDVPSVLVEAGFITNREENGRLREKDYQRKVAEGIYAGLSAYMDDQTIAGAANAPAAPAGPATVSTAQSPPAVQAALVRN